MLDIHQQIFQRKQELLVKYGRDVNINLEPERDAIVYVARNVAKDTKVPLFTYQSSTLMIHVIRSYFLMNFKSLIYVML